MYLPFRARRRKRPQALSGRGPKAQRSGKDEPKAKFCGRLPLPAPAFFVLYPSCREPHRGGESTLNGSQARMLRSDAPESVIPGRDKFSLLAPDAVSAPRCITRQTPARITLPSCPSGAFVRAGRDNILQSARHRCPRTLPGRDQRAGVCQVAREHRRLLP